MKIQINKFTEPVCELFDNTGNRIGTVSSLFEMNDVRIQIKNNKLSGYYFIYNDEKITINYLGGINWVAGFYDLLDDQLDDLLGL